MLCCHPSIKCTIGKCQRQWYQPAAKWLPKPFASCIVTEWTAVHHRKKKTATQHVDTGEKANAVQAPSRLPCSANASSTYVCFKAANEQNASAKIFSKACDSHVHVNQLAIQLCSRISHFTFYLMAVNSQSSSCGLATGHFYALSSYNVIHKQISRKLDLKKHQNFTPSSSSSPVPELK